MQRRPFKNKTLGGKGKTDKGRSRLLSSAVEMSATMSFASGGNGTTTVVSTAPAQVSPSKENPDTSTQQTSLTINSNDVKRKSKISQSTPHDIDPIITSAVSKPTPPAERPNLQTIPKKPSTRHFVCSRCHCSTTCSFCCGFSFTDLGECPLCAAAFFFRLETQRNKRLGLQECAPINASIAFVSQFDPYAPQMKPPPCRGRNETLPQVNWCVDGRIKGKCLECSGRGCQPCGNNDCSEGTKNLVKRRGFDAEVAMMARRLIHER
jgi:hypothetical protein